MSASLQLPSPPGTSHREEKENRSIFAHNARVSWSQENRIHPLTSSPSNSNIRPSSSYDPPTKSILRKVTSFPFTDAPQEVEREVTPEPESPLCDASYLAGPVSRIIPADAPMKDLIQAYSVLAARIRAIATASETAIDPSSLLFLPLKDNMDSFVNAITRDLERVLLDPGQSDEPEPKIALPSPRPSPSKKKHGMNENQVRHARDLATTTHSAIKFLALLFCSSSLCQVFPEEHLSSILTQILAIPMAEHLPTPNSRKTCALSIWLLQVQRLPVNVVGPAKDRISYALRRGIEGELGKEGKKGSASDGLKAIQDLSVHYPEIFVPTFTDLLPSILANLLAPTLPLRVQACHALGGFVTGLTSLPRSYLHTRISNAVSLYLLMPPNTPTKTGTQESTIVRTLRTLLNNQEPAHAAQGPVWALGVIACLLVLLGPAAYTDSQLSRMFTAHCSLAMRHKKSSIRALGCLTWRCITWTYFQPPLLTSDPDDEEDEETPVSTPVPDSPSENRRASWWKLVSGVIDMGAGISTIIGLLAESRATSCSEGLVPLVKILLSMVKKGGPSCVDALQIVKKLIPDVSSDDLDELEVEEAGWADLIPKGLFTSFTGLMTVEFKNLSSVVKPIFEECPAVEDIRCLTRDELVEDGVFKGLLRVWRESLRAMEIEGRSNPPPEILDIWEGLLRAKYDQVKDSTSEAQTFAEQVLTFLTDIASDQQIRPSPATELEFDELPSPSSSPHKSAASTPSSSKSSRPNSALKLFVLRHLWGATKAVLPTDLLNSICCDMLTYLKQNFDLLVPANHVHKDGDEDTREEWGMMCADVLVECSTSSVKTFLAATRLFKHDITLAKHWIQVMRALAWRSYAEKWMDVEEDWEEGVSVLLLPISSCEEPWTFTDADVKTWEKLLSHMLAKALDNGVDPSTVLDQVAGEISRHCTPTWSSATRIVDLIVSDSDAANLKDMPLEVMELANFTLVSSYPPEPRNKVLSQWLIRSVTRVLEDCPAHLATRVLEKIQEGLAIWIADEYKIFTPEEYEFDLVAAYQATLFVLQSQPDRSTGFLESFAEVIGSGYRGRGDKPSAINDAFREFWKATYGDVQEPESGWPGLVKKALTALLEPHQATDDKLVDSSDDVPEGILDPAAYISRVSSSDTTVAHDDDIVTKPTLGAPLIISNTPPFTPTRRNKVHSSSPSRLPPVHGRSPLIDVRRVPAITFYSSPTRRTLGDKENAHPVESAPVSLLGKRKLEDSTDEPAIHAKRKTNSGSKALINRVQIVGDLPDSAIRLPQVLPSIVSPETPSKKRKVRFLEAVEIPTYRQVLASRRRAVSALKIAEHPAPEPLECAPVIRRTRSASQLLVQDDGSPRKKTRMIMDDPYSSESESSLHDIQIAGSDDSIMLAKPCTGFNLSSEDDPVNVTPHLVVSPSMGARRVEAKDWNGSDPSSDDSVPDSPSKELVQRRKQRFWNVAPVLRVRP